MHQGTRRPLDPEARLEYVPRTAQVTRLLKPRAVAIIGISPEPGSMGALVHANLKQFGYRGELHFVSRNTKEIDGRACVATVDQLPEGIDAAVLAVPAAAVVDSLAACGRRGIAGAVVFAAFYLIFVGWPNFTPRACALLIPATVRCTAVSRSN